MPAIPSTIASPPLTARPLYCRACGAERAAAPLAVWEQCLGPREPVYEPGRPLPDRETIALRAPSLWRYREWLPFDGDPVWSLDTGFTPLVEAPALARRFGVGRVWVKNDTVSHPSLSFKDRVVAAAINAAAAFGLDTIGCASTGNLANAVAAHAPPPRQPPDRGPAPRPRRRAHGLYLHPRGAGNGQDRGDERIRLPAGARARDVRRRQPAVRTGGGPLRLGNRERQPARLLWRGLEDRGPRDRGEIGR